MNMQPKDLVLDVGEIIDGGRWTLFQKLVVALVATTIIFEGFDNQLLGFALPALIKDWGVPRAAFAPIVASGLVGMGVGTALAGLLGDRYGRRPTLIGCVLVFAIMTGLTVLAQDVRMLGVLRFFAGGGIGGALPIAAAAAAEFTPNRRRATIVTCTIVCVPLGGMIGGLVAAHVLPTLGWRALFAIGGVAPLAITALLAVALPETPRFLARRSERKAELARVLLRMGHALPADVRVVDKAETVVAERAGLSALFGPYYRRSTLALWAAFFFTLTAVYAAFSWAPTLLASLGFDLKASSEGLAAYNFGGVIGALSGAVLIERFGSRWPLPALALGGGLSALALTALPPHDPQLLIAAFGVHGFFVNGVQTTLYALCAYTYATDVRATGTGAGLTAGRIGTVVSAVFGAAVIGLGASAYYLALALAMAGSTVALLLVGRHIKGARAAAAAIALERPAA